MQKSISDNETKMTREIASKIINKVERTKRISLFILGIGFVLIVIGYLMNKTMADYGILFAVIGAGIGLFSTEDKKYKTAKTFIKEIEPVCQENKNGKSFKKSSICSKGNEQRNVSDILCQNSEIRISIAPGDGRCGVAYFCDKNSIKFGIEKAKKIIDILVENDFEVGGISLCGGVDELSHTGYVSYRAVYENVELFLNNAYSDYIASEKEAVAEYGSWLSCYNFSCFSMSFIKNNIKVQVLYNANGESEIVQRNYKESNFVIVNEIVNAMTTDFYRNECKISAYYSGKNGSGYFEYPADLIKSIIG